MMKLADLVRMPAGSTETYLLEPGEESYFLKKLSTYTLRTNARVDYDMYICVRLRDDTVRRMVVCKVIKAGKKLKRKKRHAR